MLSFLLKIFCSGWLAGWSGAWLVQQEIRLNSAQLQLQLQLKLKLSLAIKERLLQKYHKVFKDELDMNDHLKIDPIKLELIEN